MLKKHFSIIAKIKIEIKTTTTTVLKNELKCSPMSEDNTYSRAKPRGVTLKIIQYIKD